MTRKELDKLAADAYTECRDRDGGSKVEDAWYFLGYIAAVNSLPRKPSGMDNLEYNEGLADGLLDVELLCE